VWTATHRHPTSCSAPGCSERQDIHVVLDNLSAHKAPEIRDWLAHPRRARWHLHFTPTSSSWLNLVERWFKELTDRRLRRGTFTSLPEVIDAINTWSNDQNLWVSSGWGVPTRRMILEATAF
jgi:transposase